MSPKFEHIKKDNPGLSKLLDRLIEYIRAHVGEGEQFIIPKLAASGLGLNDGEAFVLLDMLAKGGLLRRVYNVYCRKNGILLATVDSLDALGDIPHCDFCDADHDTSALKVEVAFSPKDGDLSDMAA